MTPATLKPHARPAFSDRVIARDRYGLAGSVRRAQQQRIALWRWKLTAKPTAEPDEGRSDER